MGLSKSKLLSFLQCRKKLYLEVHKPELAEISASTQAAFDTGHAVGDLAKTLYGEGVEFEYDRGLKKALTDTQAALSAGGEKPIYEATFEYDDVLVRVDVLLRDTEPPRLVEVKAATSVKPEYPADCAIQAWVLENAGFTFDAFALAHVDNQFVYGGKGDYTGLLKEHDLTPDIRPLMGQVPEWVRAARDVVDGPEPDVTIGPHCAKPYSCAFFAYCAPTDTDYPVTGLSGSKSVIGELVSEGCSDIRDIPEGRLENAQQLRVWERTRKGEVQLDDDAVEFAKNLAYPRYYLDFETVAPVIPIWEGTRPYETLPVQYSCHIEDAPDRMRHVEFLQLDGNPPMRALAESLIADMGTEGPVLMYTNYEERIIRGLVDRFPELETLLLELLGRLVDLHPVTKQYYYHPKMLGSWSIKAVLPTVAPDLDYEALDEIKEGTAASNAYLEAIHPETTDERRASLREKMLAYCKFDTEAMVRLTKFFERGGLG